MTLCIVEVVIIADYVWKKKSILEYVKHNELLNEKWTDF